MDALHASRPYPWPYDAPVAAERIAVLVVGAQAAWRDRCTDVAATGARIAELVTAAVATGCPIVTVAHHTRHTAGTDDAPLSFPAATIAIDSAGLDASEFGALELVLRGRAIRHVVVCGYGLEGPVHSTLRGLNDRGYECLLVEDACAALDLTTRAGAIYSIEMSGGIFGAVAPTADVLAALAATTVTTIPREEPT